MVVNINSEHISPKQEAQKTNEGSLCTLATDFIGNGYKYKLVNCINNENLALYSIHTKNVESNPLGYEVHILRWQNENTTTINGKEIKFKSKLKTASNEDFGKYGWSFRTLEQVYIQFPQFKEGGN